MPWTFSGFADEAGLDIDVQIETIRKAGLKTIDLRNFEKTNISELPLDEAEAIAAKLAEANIKVGMFGSPIGKIDIVDDMQIDLDKLEHMGKLAGVFKCRKVRVFSYFNEKGATAEQWGAESIARLGQLRDLAEKLKLSLYHENERDIFGDVSDNVMKIVDALHNGKSFRMVFDFDNYNQCGENVYHCWMKLCDVTDAFHLKDSDAKAQHVPFGQGVSHARKIFSDCIKRGWNGHLALEPHLAHSPAVMATGPGGEANQALADLSDFDAWQVGAEAASSLLKELNAPLE